MPRKDTRKDQGITDDFGVTPVIIAAQNGHLEVRLVPRKDPRTDQGITDGFGVTPLIIAAQNGHSEVVRFLGGARSQQAGYRLA